MPLPFGETLTVLRSTGVDGNGDPLPGSAASTTVDGCAVWPRGTSTETVAGQDTVIIGYSALLPPATDVLATDQIQWAGDLYEVEGEPGRYQSPLTGTQPGILVALRRVTG